MSKGRYGCKAALFMAVTVTLSGLAGFGGSRVGRAVWGEGDGGVGLSFSQASPDAADPLGGLALPAMDGGEDQSGGSSELRLTGHAYDGSEAMPMDGWAQPGDVMGVGGEPAIPGLERLAAAASEALRASAYAKGNAEGPDGPMPLSIPEIASMNLDRVVEVYVEFPAGGGRSGQTNATGAGSGVIISADGYIVTNNHVIEGARKVTVRLSSGVRHEAAVVGGDEGSDIAVIKIGARRLQPAVYGDSDY
ncbi:MAG: S1C family serine protease, partial [Oscillospiraceae bacterium]|nr:S1C family serine protease [Oscillospiraceae bacterium]